MANPLVVYLHRRRVSGQARLARRAKSNVYSRIAFRSRLSFDSGGHLGNDDLAVSFLLGSQRRVEEEIGEGRKTLMQRKGATDAELNQAKWDTIVGMFFCNIVFYFVILSAAATLHASGKTDIQSAVDAAQALRPLVGDAATYLFAVGIIGSGFLAVPVLTGSSAYAIAESFVWKYGRDTKPKQAKQFYAVIAI